MLYFIITLSALLIASKAQNACGDSCPSFSMITGVETSCDELSGECVPGGCTGDGDCTNAEYPSCSDLVGGCIDPCTSDSECQARYASLGLTDTSNIVCILEFGLCTEDTSGGIDFAVNITACIGACDAQSMESGVEFVCNETYGWCDTVDCIDNTDCTNGDYTTCLSVFDHSACIDACSSDAECQQRATDQGLFMADNYYCITEVGVCEEGMSCADTTECYEGEVCEGGICREDFCETDAECDTNYVCAPVISEDLGICSAEFCRTDAACAANWGDDSFICVTGISPELPADLGYCSNEFCREGTCDEMSACITGIEIPEEEGITLPADVGFCLPGGCDSDAVCTDDYGYNDTFICAMGFIPYLPETAGLCTNDLCKEGTCGERGVCVMGVVPFAEEEGIMIPEDIGFCVPGGCYDNMDCAEQFNDTFVCVVGFFALMNDTSEVDIPIDLGMCSNEFCSEEVDNCMEDENCAIGILPPLPDYGQCIEPQCSMDTDCNGTATCLETAIGGVCIIGCDSEGAVCTDEDGMDTTCKLVPADSVLCGVPLEDTLACTMDEPGESLICTQSPTPMPTDEPTPMPTTPAPTAPTTPAPEGGGGEGEGNGAEKVILYAVMAVIAGALASM